VIELLLEAERALSFGRVDEAERLYRQVAAADPANSIAVVGLARVALEHADDAGAYLLARKALTIDSENEAAQRLVTRLDEVMRTRGETVPEPVDEPRPPTEPKAGPEPEAAPEPARAAEPRATARSIAGRRRSILNRLRGR
jgi:hypothetical protein